MNDLNLIWLKIFLITFFLVVMAVSIGFMALNGMPFSDSLRRALAIVATTGQDAPLPRTAAENHLVKIAVFGGRATLVCLIASLFHLGVAYHRLRGRYRRRRYAKRLFFTDIGIELLRNIACLDIGVNHLRQTLQISPEWKREDFEMALKLVVGRRHPIDTRCGDLTHLRETLEAKSGLLMRLLEDPVVRECENLPAMVEAVLRLRDAIDKSNPMTAMAPSARIHLERVILEVYELLILEWIRYVQQLGAVSKGLFTQAVRSNPFVLNAPAAH